MRGRWAQGGTRGTGVAGGDLQGQRDQFIAPFGHVIEHQPFEDAHIMREHRLMRIHRLAVLRIDAGCIGANQLAALQRLALIQI